jgi:tetratricopeptide (TPR) repeat protein
VNNEYGFLLVKMGKIAEALQTFELMIQQAEPGKKVKGYRSLGLLNLYLGKYSAAQPFFREAVVLDKTLKFSLSEIRERLYLASIFSQKGQREGFEREMKAVGEIQKQLKIEPYFLYLIGRAHARAGKIPEAREQLQELESRLGDLLAASGLDRSNQGDQASLHRLKGEVELAEKKYDEAVNFLSMAARLGAAEIEENLAYAFLKKGDRDQAIEKYIEFLKKEPLGYEPQESWILAHYQLGKLYQQTGRPEEARKYFERFLEIWKEGDPDLPPLIDAKKQLALLKNEPLSGSASGDK